MKRLFVVFAIVAAGIAWFTALPPRALLLPASPPQAPSAIRGAIHVHTDRSDGTGSMEEVAAAAARAGLQFVVFTDHGDGTVGRYEPRYVSGVLCIDALEISTDGGHIVALDLPTSEYPLAGQPRDVVEDVSRLGGFSIAAHPGSAREELRWLDWNAAIGGLEWLNGDSEWRDESRWSLLRALLTYPARRAETLTALLDRPDDVLRQWDILTERRRVVAVAAADAHARIGLRGAGEPYSTGSSLHVPSYEEMFRAFSIGVPAVTLTGVAPDDARTVTNAIRSGHVYSVIDGVGGPAAMSFSAMSGSATAVAGDLMRLDGSVTLRVDVQAPAEARVDLRRNGEIVTNAFGPMLEHTTGLPGVYRVEVFLPGAPGEPPVPWILSNPIYVGRDAADEIAATTMTPTAASIYASQYANGPAANWTVETSPASKGALDVVDTLRGTQLSFRYALGGAASSGPYAAMAMPAGPAAVYDRLVFTGRADKPMRISVQLRVPAGAVGERWRRSVYLDSTPRTVSLLFDEFAPAGPTRSRQPAVADVDTVLFVVDTVNTPLGGNGQIWIDDVRYAR